MGQWIIGAIINLIGSITINFGTNLLKLGHDQRFSAVNSDGANGKLIMKSIIHFQTWRAGILFFAMGNCLNFISFAYAAQSLLAALGSVQFVSNIAFSYFVLSKTVTMKVMVATAFIVFGNSFLVSFGNHLSPVYTPEELTEKYSNFVFLLYCLALVMLVATNHSIYRKGEDRLSASGHDFSPYWRILLPFSYAVVSGAVGSCSILFAKSLSNMLRLALSSNYNLHSLFTYSMLLLFFTTAGFWMARLNEGLSLFDAILIVPMFQIAWTFFSICTGFMYFQEYQVFDTVRIKLFLLGMAFIFIGITLMASDDSKGGDTKNSCSFLTSSSAQNLALDIKSCSATKLPTQEKEINETKASSVHAMFAKAKTAFTIAKDACCLPVGSEKSISASSILAMPMSSSKTTGFRRSIYDRVNFIPLRSDGWRYSIVEEDGDYDVEARDRVYLLS